MTEPRVPRVSGKVRVARLTDLAALGELSRLCQSDEAATRSLGLPVSGPPIGVFSLFRLPLGAFRPHDLMYVYEQDGRIAGLVRVEREATATSGRSWSSTRWASRTLVRSATGWCSSSCARARSGAPRASTLRAPTPTTTSSCSCRPGSCATATNGSCSVHAAAAARAVVR